jgi:hypothetical protein
MRVDSMEAMRVDSMEAPGEEVVGEMPGSVGANSTLYNGMIAPWVSGEGGAVDATCCLEWLYLTAISNDCAPPGEDGSPWGYLVPRSASV